MRFHVFGCPNIEDGVKQGRAGLEQSDLIGAHGCCREQEHAQRELGNEQIAAGRPAGRFAGAVGDGIAASFFCAHGGIWRMA